MKKKKSYELTVRCRHCGRAESAAAQGKRDLFLAGMRLVQKMAEGHFDNGDGSLRPAPCKTPHELDVTLKTISNKTFSL